MADHCIFWTVPDWDGSRSARASVEQILIQHQDHQASLGSELVWFFESHS